MKILYTNFHEGNGGGHVTYIINLLKGLVAKHALMVACPESSRLYRLASTVEGVQVIPMTFSTRPASLFGARARLHALLQRERFDVVHVNGSSDHKQVMLALLGLTHKPAVVFTKHNDHPLNSIGHRLRAMFATSHVIAVSDYVRANVLNSVYRRCPVTTVRHGIDTDFFSPVSAAEKNELRMKYLDTSEQEKIVLGSSGGTDLEKGWIDLVEAIAVLPENIRSRFHVVVAGDPPPSALVAKVSALGMSAQVSFPGLLDDVRPLLAACDVGFVLSFQEALSFACRELMALGLPVIVTRVGGLPENLTDGEEGWIVPVRDVFALSEVLRKIAEHPELIAQFGVAARAHAEQFFNLTDFAQQTLAVYQRCQPIMSTPSNSLR